jgi:hypothetical protein
MHPTFWRRPLRLIGIASHHPFTLMHHASSVRTASAGLTSDLIPGPHRGRWIRCDHENPSVHLHSACEQAVAVLYAVAITNTLPVRALTPLPPPGHGHGLRVRRPTHTHDNNDGCARPAPRLSPAVPGHPGHGLAALSTSYAPCRAEIRPIGKHPGPGGRYGGREGVIPSHTLPDSWGISNGPVSFRRRQQERFHSTCQVIGRPPKEACDDQRVPAQCSAPLVMKCRLPVQS